MRVTEIILKLENVDQMLIAPRELFYGKRMLNRNAEEFLIEESEKHPYRSANIFESIFASGRSEQITGN